MYRGLLADQPRDWMDARRSAKKFKRKARVPTAHTAAHSACSEVPYPPWNSGYPLRSSTKRSIPLQAAAAVVQQCWTSRVPCNLRMPAALKCCKTGATSAQRVLARSPAGW